MSDITKHHLERADSGTHMGHAEQSAQALLDGGCCIDDLHDMEIPAVVLRRIELSAKELHSAGYSLDELRVAGYAESELARC